MTRAVPSSGLHIHISLAHCVRPARLRLVELDNDALSLNIMSIHLGNIGFACLWLVSLLGLETTAGFSQVQSTFFFRQAKRQDEPLVRSPGGCDGVDVPCRIRHVLSLTTAEMLPSEKTAATISAVASPAAATLQEDKLWKEMIDRFQGDFDNYEQVLQDRKDGKLPRDGGGHEHIHCTLLPLSDESRLAAFYFDGQPNAIFRFRYYHLKRGMQSKNGIKHDVTTHAASIIPFVETYIYTLHPELEQQLRQCSDPMDWPGIFRKFQSNDVNANGSDNANVRLLKDCQVRWSYELDLDQHSYVPRDKKDGIHAVMVHGEALVDSQMVPGHKILIRDQISLWRDELWIHDRGHDPKTMAFIYGNQNGVPYRLRRVSNIHNHHDGPSSSSKNTDNNKNNTIRNYNCRPSRSLMPNDLSWTLGADFRNEDLYKEKIDNMGGPSAIGIRKK